VKSQTAPLRGDDFLTVTIAGRLLI